MRFPESRFFSMAALLIMLVPILFFSVAPAASSGETGGYECQYGLRDRDYDFDRSAGGRSQRDGNWYDEAYEYYERGPYGYYYGHYFYNDFDFDYWDHDSNDKDENWYERRFYRHDENGTERY